MAFESLTLKEELIISKIITIHYFEYTSTYHFPGESHNFWEFLCVDKGEVEVVAGHTHHTLTKGQIIFHKPNEFHNVNSNGKIAPNLVVIAFECDSPCMKYFEGLITSIGENERTLLAKIISEAKQCIATCLDNPYTQKMDRKEDAPFGCEQMIKIHMELLMISMIRRINSGQRPAPTVKSVKKKNDALLYSRVTSYLETHICERLTIEEICQANLVGRSQLQKLFREENQCGVIDYFSHMKIEMAKQLIREDRENFTQISDYLGYTSIHYFSRQFKKITGMSPSEYASSIKALAD
ncbi:MAG: AraC family transcriptional regulator [Clostridia bacterium]|nr:AraC family transcriptional regulator [Clostridia bacterium]NCC43120.1 AraC family transcriptional regulator [Clostridia bacterium]